ncbi:ADP compounds hydrolase NudE [Paraglaciecola sp. 2405UD69-4]|uniref:ADP compounds hydrolase NudE n=1 Tax=Paraglaciecola sp. 2405UD69-4 TaxID=3391836 RepID=UPI0039C9D0E1
MSNIDKNKTLPKIHQRKIVAQSSLMKIEQLDLEFSNGQTRIFERMCGSGRGAVMIVPFINDHEFLLVREYAAGTHTYELGFPKGLIDPGELPEVAANRELKEEVGFGAKLLHHQQKMNLATAFFDAQMHIFIAENLYPESLKGDEPEPLEVVKWSIHEMDALMAREDFNEARCIAALFLAEKWRRTQ